MENDDLIVEILEVYINYILYGRQVYPSAIFRKRRSFSTFVYKSIYPPLNDYLKSILETVRTLKRSKKLHKVEMLIYQGDTILENYIFDIEDLHEIGSDDKYLIEFEENIKRSIAVLEGRLKGLRPLQGDTSFKVVLHTTQSAFVSLGGQKHLEGFPWLKASDISPEQKQTATLLPITTAPYVGLQIYAEEYNV
ncbi:DNA polymerase zeta subunit 2 [Phlebotomus argentipes]|uniref:DNA polymerase zeta subunit 2 n=1 Tax=Phlebotomus argentipes TaxID=94469 RepID=UPI002892B5A5|nr:DNA polymerase zeta subunit 2 [Phlebotomus argentipes]